MDAQGEKNEDNDTKGICFLSFDGGGPGCISQLRMIEESMTRLAYEMDVEADELQPADYFDLMGGVGFGGFCALLLGRLRMTVYQAMEELSSIATAVFPKELSELSSPETNMDRLRESMESMLERFHHPVNLKLRDDSGSRCKVIVFAATAAHMNHCRAFRTYRSPHGGFDSTFIDAACAILALPEFFSPVTIGRGTVKQVFSGIPYGFNNPTKEVLKEAQLVFGDGKQVSLILSLGSGQQPVMSNSDGHGTLLTRIAHDCDNIARELSYQLSGAGVYLRLNVDKGLEKVKMSDWADLGSIVSSTEVYLQMAPIIAYIDEVSQWISQRVGSITLGQLIGPGKDKLKVQSQQLAQHLAIEVKQMCNIVQQGMEKITLVDAIGNRLSIPIQLCRTYSMLSGIIRLYFEGQRLPGSRLVNRGHYQLVSGTQRSTIDSSAWPFMLEPGLTVEMSMVRHDRQNHTSCPRCGLISTGWAKDEWATCLSCEARFQITEKTSEEEDLVSPSVGTTNRKGPVKGEQAAHQNEEVDEWMMFRLISVIKHLESIRQTPPTQRATVNNPVETLLTLAPVPPSDHGTTTFISEGTLPNATGLTGVVAAGEPNPLTPTITTEEHDVNRPSHARYSFDGKGEGELPLDVGQDVTVLDDQDPSWWYVRDNTTQREGIVPAAYLA